MHACKIDAIVPPDHRLSITLPDSFPSGAAEIIILAKTESLPAQTDSVSTALDELLGWQKTLPRKHATEHEVEARIRAERDAWDD